MAKEIERKFLVIDDSYKAMAVECIPIRQGYLQRDPERTVRVRTKGKHGYLTVKGITTGAVRDEFEYEVPLEDAGAMLGLCLPPVLEKRRWIVPFGGFTWEVDEFCGSLQGLVLAEVELPNESAQLEIPPFVGTEVTGDPRFYNSMLSKKGGES